MTEQEAIEELRGCADLPFGNDISGETAVLAISVLEEIQQYSALGTVEELEEVMEKQRAKKPTREYFDGKHDCCPACGFLIYNTYCDECGQKIDWSVI